MIKINTSNITSLFMGILITIPTVSYFYSRIHNKEIIKSEKKYNDVKKELDNLKNKEEEKKITDIYKSPIELARRFDNKGYVIMYHTLSTVNIELNEFIELMRMYDLPQLDGCIRPDTCNCLFRHKRCRLFMIRKCSLSDNVKFFSPSCDSVINLDPTNDDIKNETELHKFIKLYNDKFNNTITDLVNYVKYIIDPNNEHKYIVDISLVAEPYYKGQKQFRTNGYGKPDLEFDNSETYNMDTANNKYTLNWHQDKFIESKTKKPYAYDIIATFILSTNKVSPHKLMIGKLKNDNIILNTPDLDSLQEHIIPIDNIDISENNNTDIGYILDQRRNIFHKHSDIVFNDIESRRNVCTIRIKYLP